VHAQTSLLGTWTHPTLTIDTSEDFCCVPTSITIEKSKTGALTAKYQYSGPQEKDFNIKCEALFTNAPEKTDSLSLIGTVNSQIYRGQMKAYTGLLNVFDFEVKDSKLKVQYVPGFEQKCIYTMDNLEGGMSGWVVAAIIGGAVLVVFMGVLVFKKQQKKNEEVNRILGKSYEAPSMHSI